MLSYLIKAYNTIKQIFLDHLHLFFFISFTIDFIIKI